MKFSATETTVKYYGFSGDKIDDLQKIGDFVKIGVVLFEKMLPSFQPQVSNGITVRPGLANR